VSKLDYKSAAERLRTDSCVLPPHFRDKYEAAALLCEREALVQELLDLIQRGNDFDGIDHAATRVREFK
jgi:hypothetical protein